MQDYRAFKINYQNRLNSKQPIKRKCKAIYEHNGDHKKIDDLFSYREQEENVKLINDVINQPIESSRSGETLLHQAVRFNNSAYVDQLLTLGASPIATPKRNGFLPIHDALRDAKLMIFTQFLHYLKKDSRKDFFTKLSPSIKINYGLGHLAVKYNSRKIIEQLYQHNSFLILESKNNMTHTPIFTAIKVPAVEPATVQLLLDYLSSHSKHIDIKDSYQRTFYEALAQTTLYSLNQEINNLKSSHQSKVSYEPERLKSIGKMTINFFNKIKQNDKNQFPANKATKIITLLENINVFLTQASQLITFLATDSTVGNINVFLTQASQLITFLATDSTVENFKTLQNSQSAVLAYYRETSTSNANKQNRELTNMDNMLQNITKQIVSMWLQKDPDFFTQRYDQYGRLPIHYTLYDHNTPVLQLILDNLHKNSNLSKVWTQPHSVDKPDYGLGHLAAKRDQAKVIEMLYEKDSSLVLSSQNNRGETPLFIAITNFSILSVQKILQYWLQHPQHINAQIYETLKTSCERFASKVRDQLTAKKTPSLSESIQKMEKLQKIGAAIITFFTTLQETHKKTVHKVDITQILKELNETQENIRQFLTSDPEKNNLTTETTITMNGEESEEDLFLDLNTPGTGTGNLTTTTLIPEQTNLQPLIEQIESHLSPNQTPTNDETTTIAESTKMKKRKLITLPWGTTTHYPSTYTQSYEQNNTTSTGKKALQDEMTNKIYKVSNNNARTSTIYINLQEMKKISKHNDQVTIKWIKGFFLKFMPAAQIPTFTESNNENIQIDITQAQMQQILTDLQLKDENSSTIVNPIVTPLPISELDEKDTPQSQQAVERLPYNKYNRNISPTLSNLYRYILDATKNLQNAKTNEEPWIQLPISHTNYQRIVKRDRNDRKSTNKMMDNYLKQVSQKSGILNANYARFISHLHASTFKEFSNEQIESVKNLPQEKWDVCRHTLTGQPRQRLYQTIQKLKSDSESDYKGKEFTYSEIGLLKTLLTENALQTLSDQLIQPLEEKIAIITIPANKIEEFRATLQEVQRELKTLPPYTKSNKRPKPSKEKPKGRPKKQPPSATTNISNTQPPNQSDETEPTYVEIITSLKDTSHQLTIADQSETETLSIEEHSKQLLRLEKETQQREDDSRKKMQGFIEEMLEHLTLVNQEAQRINQQIAQLNIENPAQPILTPDPISTSSSYDKSSLEEMTKQYNELCTQLETTVQHIEEKKQCLDDERRKMQEKQQNLKRKQEYFQQTEADIISKKQRISALLMQNGLFNNSKSGTQRPDLPLQTSLHNKENTPN